MSKYFIFKIIPVDNMDVDSVKILAHPKHVKKLNLVFREISEKFYNGEDEDNG